MGHFIQSTFIHTLGVTLVIKTIYRYVPDSTDMSSQTSNFVPAARNTVPLPVLHGGFRHLAVLLSLQDVGWRALTDAVPRHNTGISKALMRPAWVEVLYCRVWHS